MVEWQLPKLHTRVRFPSPAPAFARNVRARAKAGASAEALCEGGLLFQATAGKPLRMHYVYLLRSERHPKQEYVGLTTNLRKRFTEHNRATSPHTSKFCPWILVAYFAFANRPQAVAFERCLKSGSGRAFAKRHLRK